MRVETFSFDTVSGVELVVKLPHIPTNAQILQLELSTEDICMINQEGIDNLAFNHVDSSTNLLQEGMELGGDFLIKISDIAPYVKKGKKALEVYETVMFKFLQSSGVGLRVGGTIVWERG